MKYKEMKKKWLIFQMKVYKRPKIIIFKLIKRLIN